MIAKPRRFLIGFLIWLCSTVGLAWLSPVHGQAPPNQGLQVVKTDPQDQQRDVAIGSLIQVQFNQPLPNDLQELQFGIEPKVTTIFDIQKDRLLIKPSQPLRFSTNYAISLPLQQGVALTKPLLIRFRTEPQFTYNRDIKPLLDASCVGCHQVAGRQRTQLLDSYQAVMAYVKPGDPASVLIDPRWTNRHAIVRTAINPDAPFRGDGGNPDPAGTLGGSPEIAYVIRLGLPVSRLGQWTAEEVAKVRTWIVQDLAVEGKATPRPST